MLGMDGQSEVLGRGHKKDGDPITGPRNGWAIPRKGHNRGFGRAQTQPHQFAILDSAIDE